MNKIILGDCLESLMNHNLVYDYVFCVPPDYDELHLHPIKDFKIYEEFLFKIFALLKPSSNIITVGITDRKYNSTILTKHNIIIDLMNKLGFKYISQKIWCKSYKINLYRLNYSFIMSFAKEPYKQKHDKRFEEDVWNNHIYSHMGYPYAIALEVVKRCIINFTDENQIVYDPFMGSGTTAIACLETNRNYLGNEINEEFYNIATDRINHYEENKEREKQQISLFNE